VQTIAISIDESTLAALDRLSGRGQRRSNRSLLVRQALAEFLARRERQAAEETERAAYRKHRALVARQARALVRAQAKR
jgi:metal-responsive CopG/Arc/MetJ family transcriptional regulator